MGQEARCRAQSAARISEGLAHLESDKLCFRGDFRLTIRFEDIRSLRAEDGVLFLECDDRTASMELGPLAQKWAEKIRSPKALVDKLGVRPDDRVTVLGIDDAPFLTQLRERLGREPLHRSARELDLIFLAADCAGDLAALGELERCLKRNGAIWVVSPKGARARIRDVDVMLAARGVGLVDTKVVSFSPTHTALKLVVPRARR
jgi:hypothetical protein